MCADREKALQFHLDTHVDFWSIHNLWTSKNQKSLSTICSSHDQRLLVSIDWSSGCDKVWCRCPSSTLLTRRWEQDDTLVKETAWCIKHSLLHVWTSHMMPLSPWQGAISDFSHILLGFTVIVPLLPFGTLQQHTRTEFLSEISHFILTGKLSIHQRRGYMR